MIEKATVLDAFGGQLLLLEMSDDWNWLEDNLEKVNRDCYIAGFNPELNYFYLISSFPSSPVNTSCCI